MTKRVLVLDSAFQPLYVVTTRKAIELTYRGSAQIICDNNLAEEGIELAVVFQPFTWHQWVDLSTQLDGATEFVHGVRGFKIRRPSVIQLRQFYQLPRGQLHLTKRNVFVRDDFTCQYCHKRFETRQLTVDHVIPTSKGGKSVWENLVACCKTCNNKKNDNLLTAAQKALLKQLKPLSRHKLMFYRFQASKEQYPEWQQFLPTAYIKQN